MSRAPAIHLRVLRWARRPAKTLGRATRDRSVSGTRQCRQKNCRSRGIFGKNTPYGNCGRRRLGRGGGRRPDVGLRPTGRAHAAMTGRGHVVRSQVGRGGARPPGPDGARAGAGREIDPSGAGHRLDATGGPGRIEPRPPVSDVSAPKVVGVVRAGPEEAHAGPTAFQRIRPSRASSPRTDPPRSRPESPGPPVDTRRVSPTARTGQAPHWPATGAAGGTRAGLRGAIRREAGP